MGSLSSQMNGDICSIPSELSRFWRPVGRTRKAASRDFSLEAVIDRNPWFSVPHCGHFAEGIDMSGQNVTTPSYFDPTRRRVWDLNDLSIRA